MKVTFYLLFIGICTSTVCWGSEVNSSNDKFYVSSESILIGENGIFAKINEHIVQSDAIFSDENGIYMTDAHIVTWICKNGHYVSPSQGNICPKCKDERRKD